MTRATIFDLGTSLAVLLILAGGLSSSERFSELKTPAERGSKPELTCAEHLDRFMTWCGTESPTPAEGDKYGRCLGNASAAYDRCIRRLTTDNAAENLPRKKTTEGVEPTKNPPRGKGDVGGTGGNSATAKP